MQQLASLSVRRSRRLELLSRYRDALASINAEAPQMRDGQDIQPLARLMVRIVRGQRRTCREVLQRVGVTSRLPYDVPESMVHADFPQATLAAETLLELPLASDAGELEVRHVVAAAAPYLARTATV
jgi:dTDP-4-amino-4,6-dideoxygalactose transaminase